MLHINKVTNTHQTTSKLSVTDTDTYELTTFLLYVTQHKTIMIIFRLSLQTVRAETLSTAGEGKA